MHIRHTDNRNITSIYQNRYFKLACRYFSYLNIFDFHEIMRYLKDIGYKPIAKVPPPEFGVRVGGSGYIAEKDNFLVYFNTHRQVLRFVSFNNVININRAIVNFIEIVEVIRINYEIEPQFYELAWELTVQPTKNPTQTFMEISNKCSFIKLINNKLNANYSMYGIKLYQGEPNSPIWSEIRIEPHIYRKGKEYYLLIVHRDKDWSRFKEFVESIPNQIETIISILKSQ